MVLVSIILILCTLRTKTQNLKFFSCIVLSESYIYCFFRKEHEKCEFETYEVYGVDVLVSTGDGKVRKKLSGSVKIWRVYSIVSNTDQNIFAIKLICGFLLKSVLSYFLVNPVFCDFKFLKKIHFLQGREQETRTTVYKKKDMIYQLKMKASRRKFMVILHHRFLTGSF